MPSDDDEWIEVEATDAVDSCSDGCSFSSETETDDATEHKTTTDDVPFHAKGSVEAQVSSGLEDMTQLTSRIPHIALHTPLAWFIFFAASLGSMFYLTDMFQRSAPPMASQDTDKYPDPLRVATSRLDQTSASKQSSSNMQNVLGLQNHLIFSTSTSSQDSETSDDFAGSPIIANKEEARAHPGKRLIQRSKFEVSTGLVSAPYYLWGSGAAPPNHDSLNDEDPNSYQKREQNHQQISNHPQSLDLKIHSNEERDLKTCQVALPSLPSPSTREGWWGAVEDAARDPSTVKTIALSSALGAAGLAIGIPYVPGITDNILVGVVGAAAPMVHRYKADIEEDLQVLWDDFENYE